MDLGYTVYFFAVFGCGGLLLLGLCSYFGWEVTRSRGRSNRTPRTRTILVVSGLLFAFLVFIPLRMLWVTRAEAILGSYTSTGVWGTATLGMRRDQTFTETWQFKNEYNGEPMDGGETHGTWLDVRRDWLTRDIEVEPFKGLATYDRGRAPMLRQATVRGYGGVTSIEVDPGADIVFFRR